MLPAAAEVMVVEKDALAPLEGGTDGDLDSRLEEEENEKPELRDFARLDVGRGDRRAEEAAAAAFWSTSISGEAETDTVRGTPAWSALELSKLYTARSRKNPHPTRKPGRIGERLPQRMLAST